MDRVRLQLVNEARSQYIITRFAGAQLSSSLCSIDAFLSNESSGRAVVRSFSCSIYAALSVWNPTIEQLREAHSKSFLSSALDVEQCQWYVALAGECLAFGEISILSLHPIFILFSRARYVCMAVSSEIVYSQECL
jgi:hypothetical protein